MLDLSEVLQYVKSNKIRVRICYEWQHMECGYISSTAGKNHEFIIIHNTNKFTGANNLLLEHIIRIEYANKKDGNILYQKQE